jgi:glycosyltransferase involved in cell wall biosynthesis
MKAAFWLWPPGWASGHDNFQRTLLEGLVRQDRHPMTLLVTNGSEPPAFGPPHQAYPVATPAWRPPARLWERRVNQVGEDAVRAVGAECVIGCAHMPMPKPAGIDVIPTVYESDFGIGLPWHVVGARWTHDNHRRLCRVLTGARAVIAISDHTARSVVHDFALPPEDVVVAAPAVPSFGTSPETVESDPYVAVVGWLHPREGIRFAIRSWAAARRKGLRHHLVLIGKAAPADVVEGDVARMALDEAAEFAGDVRWTGLIPRPDYGRVLANASALLVTSLQEGFGIAVIEAASLGTPTVATARGALTEVAASAGEVVEPSVDAVSDALLRVITDPPSPASLRAYAATFTVDAQARGVVELLDRLDEERSAR